jgi:hypothetical protein
VNVANGTNQYVTKKRVLQTEEPKTKPSITRAEAAKELGVSTTRMDEVVQVERQGGEDVNTALEASNLTTNCGMRPDSPARRRP